MMYEQKQIALKLQKIPENELTKKIIIPLLESLDYLKVEFFGGVNEEGKDILCWYLDQIGDIKLTVAQVKRFKPTIKTSDSQSFQTIINQLIACFAKDVCFTDKSWHLPTEAFLITPYEISTKAIQSRIGSHPNLHDQRIKIIDGIILADLLLKKRTDIVKELMGIASDIFVIQKPTLNNEVLLKALGYHKNKEIKSIYTDIDFSLGKISTQLFFNTSFKPIVKLIDLHVEDWYSFKKSCIKASDEFDLDFINGPLGKIEIECEKKLSDYKIWKKAKDDINNEINESELKYKKCCEQGKKPGEKTKETSKNSGRLLLLSIKRLKKELNKIKKNKPPINCKIKLNGVPLIKPIKEKRKWIEEKVSEFNNAKKEIIEVRIFIEKCKSIIDAVYELFANPYIVSCLGIEQNKTIRNNFDSTRLKWSIEKIFDTGLNLAVLGEAGAGKSTSLQMYTINRENYTDKLFIFLPIARLVQIWKKTDEELSDESKISKLDEGIAKYYIHKGVTIPCSTFLKDLATIKSVVLLDGIDEAIKLNPWLPEAINYLALKYKDVMQVIVTSRMYGSYLDKISFFAVTLLPFTNEQRNFFIEKWFGAQNADLIDKIKEHLKKNKSVNEIVRNPLLVTILCVLAEHRLPLPNTEIKLYNDRIRLLTGYYDNVKKITTRIYSIPQVLENIAQKLAFYMHKNNKREEQLDTLLNFMEVKLQKIYAKDIVKTAINELIDPCNILVPMSDDGKYGFGHLRYQEHLVAKEIASNRSIKILPLIQQVWWRGVFILYAQMNDNLNWLIREVGVESRTEDVKFTISEMIKTRSNIEQKQLTKLLSQFQEQDEKYFYGFSDEADENEQDEDDEDDF